MPRYLSISCTIFLLHFISLASSYAKFIVHPSCLVRCKYYVRRIEHEMQCIKTAFELISLPLSTVHFITFVVMRFVSFTNSHSQSLVLLGKNSVKSARRKMRKNACNTPNIVKYHWRKIEAEKLAQQSFWTSLLLLLLLFLLSYVCA